MAASEPIPQQVVQQIEKHVRSNSWPRLYYDATSEIIQKHAYKTVVEVGVALGGHAEHLLRNTCIERYFGVDPYACYDSEDGFQKDVSCYSPSLPQENFDWLFQWVKDRRLAPFNDRCRLIREPSSLAAQQFEDESIDCIFIDGDHRFEAVLQDLQAWFPKLKKGHLILGDDYWMAPVAQAVESFFSDQGKPVIFFTAQSGYKIWAVYK